MDLFRPLNFIKTVLLICAVCVATQMAFCADCPDDLPAFGINAREYDYSMR